MKKTTIASILFALLFAVPGFSQLDGWRSGSNEISAGVRIFPLGIKDVQYKKKLTPGNLWLRTSLTDLSIRNGETGFAVGLEKQKNLLIKSRITYGLEAGTFLDYDKFDNTFVNTSVDLGIPVGVQIHLTKRMFFGVEARPSIGIYESQITQDTNELIEDYFTVMSLFNGMRAAIGFRF